MMRAGTVPQAVPRHPATRPPLLACWALAREAASSWLIHKDARTGAALAYYSVFSLGPLMVIAIAVAGAVFGRDAAQGEIQVQLQSALGDTAAAAVNAMLVGASAPRGGLLASAIGTAVLLFTAVGVVVELKDAFNTVWEVDARKVSGFWQFVRTYLVSLAAVLTLGVLLLVSLILTAALSAAGAYLGAQMPVVALQLLNTAASFVTATLAFAMMFRFLPDADVAWRDVGLGAALTAGLFEIGKLLIGLYVGRRALESTYGAATSLVVILIWIYYSSQIVLLGAEFTYRHSLWRRNR
jgi:membrane protein